MNKENVERLLKELKENTEKEWDICKCNSCFMGFMDEAFPGSAQQASTLLGLDGTCPDDSNNCLLMPPHWQYSLEYPRERAIRQLEYFLATGEVDWSATPYIPEGGNSC